MAEDARHMCFSISSSRSVHNVPQDDAQTDNSSSIMYHTMVSRAADSPCFTKRRYVQPRRLA